MANLTAPRNLNDFIRKPFIFLNKFFSIIVQGMMEWEKASELEHEFGLFQALTS